MKKNVFVVYDRNIGKDEFDLLHTFDKEEAIKYAKYRRETQSSYDRKHSEHFVIGYAIDCADDETAEAAYNRVVLEDELTDEDQVFYLAISDKQTLFEAPGIEVFVEYGFVVEEDDNNRFEYEDTAENRKACIEDAKRTVEQWKREENA